MSAGTNAFGARAGFNQSGGGHFMTLVGLDGNYLTGANATTPYINTLLTAGSNSGGAFSNPTFALTNMSTVIGAGTAASNASSIVGPNRLLEDMGRTVVSAGRTFRKFAPVVSGAAASTFGVVGQAGATPNTGFGSFYLEVGREGAGSTPAPIVRYF
jgi:hypothetical protein